MRPQSNHTTPRPEGNRLSKPAPSLSSLDGLNTSHHFSFHHRHGQDDFTFPRPDTDEEIEALFQVVKQTRVLGHMPNLSIDQKWAMVYNDEHLRWQTEKGEGTPEWYIKKFLNETITAKQASSLQVSLRTKELRWVRVRCVNL
jgi:cytokinesis protein